jgi:septal ring factor EnvC (AmiA/AmiB activator)
VTRPAIVFGVAVLAAAAAAQTGDPPSPEAGVPAATPAPGAAPAAQPPADSRDQRLRRVQERRQALERELAALRKQEKSLLGEVEGLELEERLRAEQLRETKLLLERTNAQMDVTLVRVRSLDRSVAETRPVLAARARALYKLGELSYLRMLLSVDRPSDIFRGYRFVTTLARRDNDRLAAFRADLAALTATRLELERRTQEALALRSELERTRRTLEANRKRKTELLTQIIERKETHAAYVKELADAEASLRQLLDGLAEGEVAVPLTAFRSALPWPAPGKLRVPFGLRKHPKFDTYTLQNGIEIDAPADAPVRAIHEGNVVFADRFLGYGLMVIVDHGSKHHSLYAHLGEVSVKQGQRVDAGETLGTVGPGLDGPGVYFEMRFQGKPEDPMEWLKKSGGQAEREGR